MIFRTIFRGIQPRVLMSWGVLLVAALGGGSSWPNVLSLLYVRPVLAFTGIAALVFYRRDFRGLGSAAILMALVAAWIAIQMIPLPPILWHHLPGHTLIKTIGAAAGVSAAWRPISISPDATLNSLLACIPALAALAVVAPLDDRTRRSLIGPLLILILSSMVLGVGQIASGDKSFMLFRQSNNNTAVGLFANRNHFALLLTCGLPLFSAWSLREQNHVPHSGRLATPFLAGIGALLILVMIIATGSRAGLALAGLAAVAAGIIRLRNTPKDYEGIRWPRRRTAIVVVVCIATTLLILGATTLLKGVAFERMFKTTSELSTEKRIILAPVIFSSIAIYFPFGSGFGTFDHMFRQIEPDWALTPTYFNHAHNELLELLLTGGLPAALLLAAFVAYVIRLSRNAMTGRPGPLAASTQAGATMIILTMLASLVDYPLRTPLMDVVMVFAVALAGAESRTTSRPPSPQRRGSAVALDGGRA
jgi:O-antigen ligase